uniref:Mitochondrial 2-oxoglutarate/malate carrier protein n=1 Tax=Globodera rostochiensis TaxID=31243 RepID=A0A914HLP3_GLORO
MSSPQSAAATPTIIQQQTIPNAVKFLFGGIAGMGATLFVQPLDLVKNRMQLSGMQGKPREFTSTFHAIRTIMAREGPLAMYNGLSAGLARQATYTTTRLGIYSWLIEQFSTTTTTAGESRQTVATPPSFALKALLGMGAGGVASVIGNPMELALVRMTADGRLPPAERRNYTSVFNALVRVTREEGVPTLWRGCTPTVIRAMVVNAAQLATYSQAKQQLLATGHFHEGIPLHFCASMASGLATTVASMPVDIVKTRIQNMRIVDGRPEFSGVLDVVRRVLANEGIFALWKGFLPYYMRLGPHTVLTFIILEQMNAFYRRMAAARADQQLSKTPL